MLVSRGQWWAVLMVPWELAAREVRMMGARVGALALAILGWCLLVSSGPRTFLPAHIFFIHRLPQGHRDPASVVLLVEVAFLALLWMVTTPRRAYFLHLLVIGTWWTLDLPPLPGVGHPLYAGVACATILIEWQMAARLSLALREEAVDSSKPSQRPSTFAPSQGAKYRRDQDVAMV